VGLTTLDPLGLPLATEVVAGDRADDPLDVPLIKRVRATLAGAAYGTDAPAATFSATQAVLAYRDEYLIERDFGRLKGRPLSLTPLSLSLTPLSLSLTPTSPACSASCPSPCASSPRSTTPHVRRWRGSSAPWPVSTPAIPRARPPGPPPSACWARSRR